MENEPACRQTGRRLLFIAIAMGNVLQRSYLFNFPKLTDMINWTDYSATNMSKYKIKKPITSPSNFEIPPKPPNFREISSYFKLYPK